MVIAEVLMNGDDELRTLMQAAIDKHLEMIEAQLTAGIQRGEVRSDVDVKAAALQFYGLIQAVNTLNHFVTDADHPIGDSAALWKVFKSGVAAQTPSTTPISQTDERESQVEFTNANKRRASANI